MHSWSNAKPYSGDGNTVISVILVAIAEVTDSPEDQERNPLLLASLGNASGFHLSHVDLPVSGTKFVPHDRVPNKLLSAPYRRESYCWPAHGITNVPRFR